MKQAAKQLCGYASTSLVRMPGTTGKHHAGCSKRLSSKAAASEEARRTLRYVEPLSDARTKVAGFFSVLLGAAVEGERLYRRVVTCAIDFNGELGAGG